MEGFFVNCVAVVVLGGFCHLFGAWAYHTCVLSLFQYKFI